MVGGPGCLVVVSAGRLRRWPWMWSRLIARGMLRWRRGGLGRSVISAMDLARAVLSRPGGKCRLVGYLAADDPQ